MRTTLRRILAAAFFIQFAIPFDARAENGTFKIGLAVCFTGECAGDGDSTVKGAELAASELNAIGGVLGKRITFESQDTADAVSGARAMSAYRQLRLNPSIHYFIGPSWTPGALTLAPIVSKDAGVIIATPSVGVKEFHMSGNNVFNMRGTDEVSTRALAKVAFERGWRRAAIFSSQQPWELLQGNYFEEEFKKLGGQIVAKVEPLPTITSLNGEALRIKSSNPDVIFFSSVVQLGIAAKELRKLGWHGPQLAAFVDDTRLSDAAGALEGVMYMTFSQPTSEFSEKYRARYGRRPEIPAGASYDIVYAYAKAIEEAKSFDTTLVQSYLLKVRFNGSSGEVQFDKDGCAIKQIRLWTVENGSYKALP